MPLPEEEITEPKTPKTPKKESLNPLTRFLHDETVVHESDEDELIDIHIGNPLRKITELLQDIKRQKAFSFTLKGSLGIMGVVMVAGTFGVLGGTKALCDKGIQTKIGIVKVLHYQDPLDETWLDYVPILNTILPKHTASRTIMFTPDNKIIRIKLPRNSLPPIPYTLNPVPYFATGNFDTCSQTISMESQDSLEPNQ